MALYKHIANNDLILPYLKKQQTYSENEEGIFLTPDFYYAYEMLRQAYENKDGRKSDLLTAIASEKPIRSVAVSPMFYFTPKERKPNLAWPEETTHVEVQNTGLLALMMRVFPYDYLLVDFRCDDRSVSGNAYSSLVPEEMWPAFKALSFDKRDSRASHDVNTKHVLSIQDEDSIVKIFKDSFGSASYSREPESADTLLPWYLSQHQDYSFKNKEPEHTWVLKMRQDFTVVSAASILLYLKDDYFGRYHFHEPNNLGLEEIIGFVVGMQEDFLNEIVNEMTENVPKYDIKNKMFKSMSPDEKKRLVDFYSKNAIFSPIGIQSIAVDRMTRMLMSYHFQHPAYVNSYYITLFNLMSLMKVDSEHAKDKHLRYFYSTDFQGSLMKEKEEMVLFEMSTAMHIENAKFIDFAQFKLNKYNSNLDAYTNRIFVY